MKSNKKTKKLEFTKETVARLGDQQLNGFQGGTGGPDTNASKMALECTLANQSVGFATCNVILCRTK